MKKTIIKVAASASILLSLSSCSDWLQVEMEDKIMEPVLFSNYPGYVAALNGVYMSLNDYYTVGSLNDILDVMAQYYYVTDDMRDNTYRIYQSYSFSDAGFESKNGALWNKAYTLIANTNTILDHLTSIGDTPLSQTQYNVLRGEALAMRAMLHFDILRRHGAIYATNPDAETIPYQDDTSREIKPFLTNKAIMERIIGDLTEASSLLKESDPIITEGIRDTQVEDNSVASYDMSFRQLRLNYYAVQGLLARAYQWIGDKTNAYKVAKEEIIDKVTTESLEVFPWITDERVHADGKPDLMFSTEVMFSLYHNQRSKYNSAVFASSISSSLRLTFYGENKDGEDSKVGLLYDYVNDYRRDQWALADPPQGVGDDDNPIGTTLYLTKYDDFKSGATEETFRYMLPMIRLSEMYLIAAESASNADEAYRLLNEVRLHRNCPSLETSGNFNVDLLYEFARETLAEGQLYYFYKRRQETRIISRTGSYDFNMLLSNYIWPIPEAELNKRTHSGK